MPGTTVGARARDRPAGCAPTSAAPRAGCRPGIAPVQQFEHASVAGHQGKKEVSAGCQSSSETASAPPQGRWGWPRCQALQTQQSRRGGRCARGPSLRQQGVAGVLVPRQAGRICQALQACIVPIQRSCSRAAAQTVHPICSTPRTGDWPVELAVDCPRDAAALELVCGAHINHYAALVGSSLRLHTI